MYKTTANNCMSRRIAMITVMWLRQRSSWCFAAEAHPKLPFFKMAFSLVKRRCFSCVYITISQECCFLKVTTIKFPPFLFSKNKGFCRESQRLNNWYAHSQPFTALSSLLLLGEIQIPSPFPLPCFCSLVTHLLINVWTNINLGS